LIVSGNRNDLEDLSNSIARVQLGDDESDPILASPARSGGKSTEEDDFEDLCNPIAHVQLGDDESDDCVPASPARSRGKSTEEDDHDRRWLKESPERTPKTWFFSFCVTNDVCGAKELLGKHRTLVTCTDGREGNTGHILAAMEGHLPIVQLLQESGADLEHANSEGRNALMEAALWGRLSVVNYLSEIA
jgi:hypothetical protein